MNVWWMHEKSNYEHEQRLMNWKCIVQRGMYTQIYKLN